MAGKTLKVRERCGRAVGKREAIHVSFFAFAMVHRHVPAFLALLVLPVAPDPLTVAFQYPPNSPNI